MHSCTPGLVVERNIYRHCCTAISHLQQDRKPSQGTTLHNACDSILFVDLTTKSVPGPAAMWYACCLEPTDDKPMLQSCRQHQPRQAQRSLCNKSVHLQLAVAIAEGCPCLENSLLSKSNWPLSVGPKLTDHNASAVKPWRQVANGRTETYGFQADTNASTTSATSYKATTLAHASVGYHFGR